MPGRRGSRSSTALAARLLRPRSTIVRAVVGAPAVLFACLSYSWVTLPDVRPLAAQPPATTAFMRLRAAESRDDAPTADWRWVPYARISEQLRRAVVVTEDAGFWGHDGVDYAEQRIAIQDAVGDGTMPRGASTLTQQLAKNLYLSPSRNPYRKFVELLITRRLEAELSKTRILEIYLNVVEWGDGIWGAEAAARRHFNRPAADLSAGQAALLAGALINPRGYSPASPNRRLLARQRLILARMGSGTAPRRASLDDEVPVEATPEQPARTSPPQTGPVIQLPAPPR